MTCGPDTPRPLDAAPSRTRAAGHYGPAFPFAEFMATAALSIAIATAAEAVSPPHVDNLLVTYAAAAVGFCLAESGVAPYLTRTCA